MHVTTMHTSKGVGAHSTEGELQGADECDETKTDTDRAIDTKVEQ